MVELEFGDVSYCGGDKTRDCTWKKKQRNVRTNNKLNPHDTAIEPGPHWSGKRTLTHYCAIPVPSLLSYPSLPSICHIIISSAPCIHKMVSSFAFCFPNHHWFIWHCKSIFYIHLCHVPKGLFSEIIFSMQHALNCRKFKIFYRQLAMQSLFNLYNVWQCLMFVCWCLTTSPKKDSLATN